MTPLRISGGAVPPEIAPLGSQERNQMKIEEARERINDARKKAAILESLAVSPECASLYEGFGEGQGLKSPHTPSGPSATAAPLGGRESLWLHHSERNAT